MWRTSEWEGFRSERKVVMLYCFIRRYESFIDAEVQQRAVEYFALSRKGMSMMDVLAEMPKFPEREVRFDELYSG